MLVLSHCRACRVLENPKCQAQLLAISSVYFPMFLRPVRRNLKKPICSLPCSARRLFAVSPMVTESRGRMGWDVRVVKH